MKLSKYQKQALETMFNEIKTARECEDFKTWLFKTNGFLRSKPDREEYYKNNKEYYDLFKEYYENGKNGIVLSNAGKRTLECLVKKGLIEIVKISEHRNTGCVLDWIKVIE